MIDYIYSYDIKEKFGHIISKLFYGAKIDIENINYKILSDDFFDFFEKNDLSFLGEQYQTIAKQLFNANIINETNNTNPLYWAGIEYMNICLNLFIPLKQVVLLCPLQEMINHYDIYHEMNDIEILKEFLNNEYKRSILKNARKLRNVTINELSVLTNISSQTLKYYEKSNDNLFNASFINIEKIARALDLSLSIFKRKSSFVYINKNLLENNDYISTLKGIIKKYYNIKENDFIFELKETALIKYGKKQIIIDSELFKKFILLTNYIYIDIKDKINVII